MGMNRVQNIWTGIPNILDTDTNNKQLDNKLIK